MFTTSHLSALYADWTLIVFTVFAQFAAGTALFATLFQSHDQANMAKKFWWTAFILMVIAGIVSILHLQNPFNALYTLTQVGHSWLSREIWTVGIFSGLVFLQLIKPHKLLAYVTALAGLALVFVISQVYASVQAMPFWANAGTVIGFYGTAFILGGAFALLLGKNVEDAYFRKYAMASLILGLVLSLASKLSWVAVFMHPQMLTVPADFTSSLYHISMQVVLMTLGLAFVLPQKVRGSVAFLCLGMLYFLLAELSGRAMFFLAQLKIGV